MDGIPENSSLCPVPIGSGSRLNFPGHSAAWCDVKHAKDLGEKLVDRTLGPGVCKF